MVVAHGMQTGPAWYACDVDSHEFSRELYVPVPLVCNLREEVACRSALRLQGAAGGDEQPECHVLNVLNEPAEGEPDV